MERGATVSDDPVREMLVQRPGSEWWGRQQTLGPASAHEDDHDDGRPSSPTPTEGVAASSDANGSATRHAWWEDKRASRPDFYRDGWPKPFWYRAAAAIQACARAWTARLRYPARLERDIHRRIVVPASVGIQRIFRGWQGRRMVLTVKVN